MLLVHLKPEQVMRLIQAYQKDLGKTFRADISGVFPACADVTVKALQTQDMAISFGCNDPRLFGGLTDDRLYAGLPYFLVNELLQ